MRLASRLMARAGAAPAVVMLTAGLAGAASPAGAASLPAAHPVSGSVLPDPAPGTPELLPGGVRRFQQVYQLVPCGGIMYAVGDFSHVGQNGTSYPRSNVFSFLATAPYTITSWAPQVNGRINAIAFGGGDCRHAYIGGQFTMVNGTPVKHIAKISTTTGDVAPGFAHSASGAVDTIVAARGHLLVGGKFTVINGSHKDPYFASLNPRTGVDDGFLRLDVSGKYNYCGQDSCTHGLHTSISSQQLSHGRTLDLAEGIFTSVGGQPRQQIFMLNLATDPATVTGWTSPQWDGSDGNLPGGYPYQCVTNEAYYIRSAAWSPDDSTVYIASTGYHPWNANGAGGLCDAAAAFPATQKAVTGEWVEYTGCDSYYSVAADTGTVYVAGHPRWADNPHGCDNPGPGAVRDHGLQGLNPGSGQVEAGSAGKPVYSMARANASYMAITGAGLWIASSNRYGANTCAGIKDHAGICFLPYPGH